MARRMQKILSLIIILLCFINGCFGSILFHCDFEGNSLHGMTQDSTDDFDWDLIKGSTPTENTGPTGDHTSVNGTGYFLYLEGSNKGNFAKARILTPEITKTSNKMCLHFYYHMHGDHLGTLNVYMEITDIHSNTSYRREWHKSGEQGDKWLSAEKEISLSDEVNDIKVVFEAIRGHNFRSDIGIDDIVLTDKPCNGAIPQVTSSYVFTVPEDTTTVFHNETIETNVTSSVTSAHSSGYNITMTTLFIIVCCGVAFWTLIFILIGVYIIRNKPPTLEELRHKYENNQVTELQNNLNETELVRETIINYTATDSHNDDVSYHIEHPTTDTQINVDCYDSTDGGESWHSSDEIDLPVSRTPEDDNVFKELLQKFQTMDTSKVQ